MVNRHKQETEFKNTGTGHVRGYAGLVHTSLPISEYIPKSKIYVEPFAGLGRVSKYVQADRMILNDMSDYAVEYLSKHFKAEVEQKDFVECIMSHDSSDTFFLIDPPWSAAEYEKGCLGRAFCDRTPKEYYDKLFEILPTLKGNWILCGNKNNGVMKNSGYETKLIQSRMKIMGGRISTLLVSNTPFIRYHQEVLFN